LEAFEAIRSIAADHADKRVAVLQEGHAAALEAKDRIIHELTETLGARDGSIRERDEALKAADDRQAADADKIARLEQGLALQHAENRRLNDELLRATEALAQARKLANDEIFSRLEQIAGRNSGRKSRP
jgi:hypothetical protein